MMNQTRHLMKLSNHLLKGAMSWLLLCAVVSCRHENEPTQTGNLRFGLLFHPTQVVTRAYQEIDVQTDVDYSRGVGVGVFYNPSGENITQVFLDWDGHDWHSAMRLDPNPNGAEEPYLFFAYMPRRDNARFNTATNTLTLPAIKALGDEDILVSAGIDSPATGTAYGRVVTATQNSVVFLMDHILCKLRLHFSLPQPYADLRRIEVLSVSLETPVPTGTYSVRVPFNTVSGGLNSLTWTPNNDANERYSMRYLGDESTLRTDDADEVLALQLETSRKLFGQCYVAADAAKNTTPLKMTVVYNVYDQTGQLVRENQVSVNNSLRISGNTGNPQPGRCYDLTVKVVPSYLYVLSDNDQTNPYLIID